MEELVNQLSDINKQRHPASRSSESASTSLPRNTDPVIPGDQASLPSPVAEPTLNLGSNIRPWNVAGTNPSFLDVDDEPDIIDRGILVLGDARELLETFRRSFMTSFPFVVLPADTTAESLRREKPFLFLSILAVAAFRNSALQLSLGKEIQRQIATRIIMRNEKNLDILQGLVIYIAYYHFFFVSENQQIYLLIQLTLAMIHELGLDHSPRSKKASDGTPVDWAKEGSAERSGQRTTDEIRTFLGVYVLSDEYVSLISLARFMISD